MTRDPRASAGDGRAPWAHSICAETCRFPNGCMNPDCPNHPSRRAAHVPAGDGLRLSEAEREALAVFTDGTYSCASAERCSGYDDNKPGHMHENLLDAVEAILADRLLAAHPEPGEAASVGDGLAGERRKARAEALREAAQDVDLSGYYDPSTTGGISTSCHLAENAMRDWLRLRAALEDGDR